MNDKEPRIDDKIGDKLKQLFTENPSYFGWFIVAVGVMFVVTAVIDAEWLFGHARTFNLGRIEGWVNFFGRNATRAIVGGIGLFIITIGIVWVWISNK